MAEKKYLDLEGLTQFKALCDEAYAINGALVFKGTVATISALPTVAGCSVGDMYNVTTGGQTTADFVEGAGQVLDDGENVVCVEADDGAGGTVKKWDILGGVLDVSNKLTFGSAMPAAPEDGDTFLYLGNTSYVYTPVVDPDPAANPVEEGWYVSDGAGGYEPTVDTEVQSGTTYYTRAEEFVKGVIYVYSSSATSWIAQSSGDQFTPITTAEINALFA